MKNLFGFYKNNTAVICKIGKDKVLTSDGSTTNIFTILKEKIWKREYILLGFITLCNIFLK